MSIQMSAQREDRAARIELAARGLACDERSVTFMALAVARSDAPTAGQALDAWSQAKPIMRRNAPTNGERILHFAGWIIDVGAGVRWLEYGAEDAAWFDTLEWTEYR